MKLQIKIVAALAMRRWFLSYRSPDEALAERLKAGIERYGDGAIVFFAPANLRAGARWAPPGGVIPDRLKGP